MRAIAIVVGAFLISEAIFAADQAPAGANSKLAAMLAAKDANGKPIISTFTMAELAERFEK